MRILVQNCKTGEFLTPDDRWSADPSHAREFESSAGAVSFCVDRDCEDVQVVLKFPRDDMDVKVPISKGCRTAERPPAAAAAPQG